LNGDDANIPNHAASLTRANARLEEKAATVANKAPDKAYKKAAAEFRARALQRECNGWCERYDCGQWPVMNTIDWSEREFHC
jgi:hypothetical protein